MAMGPFRVGDLVAAAGNEYALHAEYNWVPVNLCAAVPRGVAPEHAAVFEDALARVSGQLAASARAWPEWRALDVEKRGAILHKAAALLREDIRSSLG